MTIMLQEDGLLTEFQQLNASNNGLGDLAYIAENAMKAAQEAKAQGGA